MKNLKYVLAGLLFSIASFGALSSLDKSFVGADNKLSNPGFEAGASGWSAASGTFTAVDISTLTNVPEGTKAGKWTGPTGTSRLCSTTTFYAENTEDVVASCRFFCPSGTCNHQLEIYDTGVPGPSVSTGIINDVNSFKRTSVKWLTTGSPGTPRPLKLCVLTVGGSEPDLYLDSCYLGAADLFVPEAPSPVYTPAVPANWPSPTPSSLPDALDILGDRTSATVNTIAGYDNLGFLDEISGWSFDPNYQGFSYGRTWGGSDQKALYIAVNGTDGNDLTGAYINTDVAVTNTATHIGLVNSGAVGGDYLGISQFNNTSGTIGNNYTLIRGGNDAPVTNDVTILSHNQTGSVGHAYTGYSSYLNADAGDGTAGFIGFDASFQNHVQNGYTTGFNFNKSSSTIGNFTDYGLSINNANTATGYRFQGISVTQQGNQSEESRAFSIFDSANSRTKTGIDVVLQGTATDDVSGIRLNMNSQTGTDIQGLNINMPSTPSNVRRAISTDNGSISMNMSAYIPDATGAAFLNQFNVSTDILDSAPVAGTFGANWAFPFGLQWHDNMGDDGTGADLGWSNLGFLGQFAGTAGKTVQTFNFIFAGGSGANSDGTITNVNGFRFLGAIDFGGGVPAITNMKGVNLSPISCGTSSNCWGIWSGSSDATNYFRKNIVVGSTTETATGGATLDVTGDQRLKGELRFEEPSGSSYVGFKAPALSANQIWELPSVDGASGECLMTDGAGVLSFGACTGGGGGVSSVALALPGSVFSVSGSPVTSSGTLTGAFVNQGANTLFAGPSTGSPAAPTFRAMVAADIPATAVTPGSYTNTNLTVDAAGRITTASNGSVSGSPLTTKGGMYTFDGTSDAEFLPCPDGQLPIYDSSQTTGWNCYTPAGGGSIASTRTIYLNDLDGDDTTGDGTFSKPYQTLSKARTVAQALGAGYFITIKMAPGTYTISGTFDFEFDQLTIEGTGGTNINTVISGNLELSGVMADSLGHTFKLKGFYLTGNLLLDHSAHNAADSFYFDDIEIAGSSSSVSPSGGGEGTGLTIRDSYFSGGVDFRNNRGILLYNTTFGSNVDFSSVRSGDVQQAYSTYFGGSITGTTSENQLYLDSACTVVSGVGAALVQYRGGEDRTISSAETQDKIIRNYWADTSAGAYAIGLVGYTDILGRETTFKKTTTDANVLTLTGTVDGITNPTATYPNESYTIKSDRVGELKITNHYVPGTKVSAKGNLLTSDGTKHVNFGACTNDYLAIWDSSAAPGMKCESPSAFTALLDVMQGDGFGGAKGLVPAQVSGDADKFLKGNATWATALELVNNHIKIVQATDATAAPGGGAGTGATCTLASGSSDTAGTIQLTTGALGLTSGDQCDITFNQTYGTAPKCTITANDGTTGLIAAGPYLTKSTTGFNLNFGTAAVPATSYSWDYHCVQSN